MITFHRLTSADAYTAARKLVYAQYSEQGYIADDETEESGMRTYIGRDGVVTIGAYVGDELIGTVSLACGNQTALPMESLYTDEINALRTQHISFGEVCQFAVNPTNIKEKSGSRFDVMLGLLAAVIAIAREEKITTLCFVINPKHVAFYESLGAQKMGEEKSYDSVNGAPARAYTLDISSTNSTHQNMLFNTILLKANTIEIM